MSAFRFFDKFAKLLDVNWAAIADGQFLRRSGSNIVGAAAAGDVVGPASSVVGGLPYFSGATGKVLADWGPGFPGVVKVDNAGVAGSGPGQIKASDLHAEAIYGQQQTTAVEFGDRFLIFDVSADRLGYIYEHQMFLFPRWHIDGFSMINNATDLTNDIDIGIGECVASDDYVNIKLTTALTKRLDAAWALGTNQGGRDTGAIADGTWHVWVIRNNITGVADVCFSLSAAAPTNPTADPISYRRIGSIIRKAGVIEPFVQRGDYFWRKTTPQDVNVSALTTARSNYVLSVPLGIDTIAMVTFRYVNAAIVTLWLGSPYQTDAVPSATHGAMSNVANQYGAGGMHVLTNNLGQISARSTAATTTLQVWTHGWIDSRGKYN